jgi:hypothetical protein
VDGATTLDETTIDGDLTITGNVDGVDVASFKSDYDAKIDQGVKTTDSPTFAGATVNGNIAVTGTVDGQDLSARLNQNVKTPDNVTFNQGRFNNIFRAMRESFFFRTITALQDLIVNQSATIQGNLTVNGKINGPSSLPVGSTVMWWDETPPAGWIENNGDLLPIASYPELFSVRGSKFGLAGSWTELPVTSASADATKDWADLEDLTDIFTQDEVGGRTLTANSNYKFASNYKVLSFNANSIDMLNMFYDGSRYYVALTTGYA